MRRLFIFLSLCFSSISVADKTSRIELVYELAKGPNELRTQAVIQASGVVEDALELIQDNFRLSCSLTVRFGGQDGPLFDPERFEIQIPYAFLQDVTARFKKVNYAASGVNEQQATLDTLIHTLFHEIGHALIVMHDLPIVGKEEDAVDGLANMLLIEYYEEGAEIAISAADLFSLESEEVQVIEEMDFWDEHSLDAQRYYSTLCHVYGSDPKKYDTIRQDIGWDEERAEFCVAEYNNLVRSWQSLLAPAFKH